MLPYRVNLMGISDIVKIVQHDFTADSVFSVLPAAGSADVITMSYSYSMIPDKEQAIVNAKKLLKIDGLLAIADFFLKGNYDDCLPFLARNIRYFESMFHKYWFAMDHVYLLSDEQLDKVASNGLEEIWDNRFRGAVPFLPFLNPYHGVVIMKKVSQ